MPKVLTLRSRSLDKQLLPAHANETAKGPVAQDPRHSIIIESCEILNDGKIQECMAEIHQLSLETIVALERVVHLDEYSWPALRDADYWYKDTYVLLRDAMHLDMDEPLDSGFRRLQVDLKDIGLYIRMIIAAELTDQAFVSSFPRVPLIDRDWAIKVFSSLAKGDADKKDKLATQALTAWRDDPKIRNQILKNSETFAESLIQSLSPLLSSHKQVESDSASDRKRQRTLLSFCKEHLEGMYLVAITLRHEMNLKRCEYEFFWPNVGEPLDPKTMDEEVMHRRKECGMIKQPDARVVKGTLLPGVRRVGEDGGRNYSNPPSGKEGMLWEKIVVKALVQLRNGIDQY